jgi:hypothetical protein
MLKFLKNLFSQKSFSKKQKVLILSFLLFSFILLTLPSSVSAQWGWLKWIPEKIAQAIAGLLLAGILALAQAILNLGIICFNWALNGIPVSFTDPAKNEIIRVGWTLVRDLTNMTFILGLVYIGLATALRIAGFNTKQVFGWFLIMTLFVNFTPVICGIVVDAANLVMNFFLRGPGGWEILNSVFDEQRSLLSQYTFGEPKWDLYLKVLVLAAFGFITGIIFLLYALLFLVRYPAIWLLVIFSPFAFFAYIFPQTKKWFEMWWRQLLQWSFIGAIAGFFLYLAQYTLLLAKQGDLSIGGTPEGVFNDLAPYFVAVVFLGIGFYTSTMTSAWGASTIVGFAKTRGKAALKWGSKKIGKATGVVAAGLGAAGVGAMKGMKAEKGVKGRIKGALKGALTREGREMGRETIGRLLERAHLVRPGWYEETRRKRWELEEELKRLEKLPNSRLEEIIKRPALTKAEVKAKAAATEILGKRHSFDLKDPNLERNTIRRAQAFGVNLSELIKGRPDLAPIVNSSKVIKLMKEKSLNQEEAERQVIRETIEGMSPRQFTQSIQPVAMKPETFIWINPSQIRHMGERGTLEQKRKLAELSISPELFTYQRKLAQQGKTEEVNKIQTNRYEIALDPNYQGII